MSAFARSGQIVKGIVRSGLFRGVKNLAHPTKLVGTYAHDAKRIAQGITAGNIQSTARRSALMLGTTIGLGYTARAVRGAAGGSGVFKNRKGKRDMIPFVPFI